MNIELVKKLIDESILSFEKLLMKHYKDILLSELEAMVLLELYHQKEKGNTFLNPTKIIKSMTIPKDDLLMILDGLIKKGYLTIQLKKQKNDRETEVFFLDETIKKILAFLENQIRLEIMNDSQQFSSPIEEIVSIIETQFHKQMSPLEVEIISKWISQDAYNLLDIKKALFDALKSSRFSISYVDTILLKRKKAVEKKDVEVGKTEKSAALQTFLDTWDQS